MPKSTSVTLAVDEKTLPMAAITGRTDRRTDRVRRNMRPPPREEGRIIIVVFNFPTINGSDVIKAKILVLGLGLECLV